MEAIFHSADGNTDFFDIVAQVLKVGIVASYLFILCLGYALPASIDLIKGNSFTLKKQEADNIPLKLEQM